MAEGWGSAIGRLTKWTDRFFDPRKRLEAKIQNVERKIDAEKKQIASVDQSRALDRLVSELSRLRAERARLKD